MKNPHVGSCCRDLVKDGTNVLSSRIESNTYHHARCEYAPKGETKQAFASNFHRNALGQMTVNAKPKVAKPKPSPRNAEVQKLMAELARIA